MTARRSNKVAVAAVSATSLVLAGCSLLGGNSDPPTQSSAVPLDSLCAAISDQAFSAYSVFGDKVPFDLAVPLHVQSPDIAGCEYHLIGDVLDITVAPVMQSGVDRFAELQHDQAFVQQNVDGIPAVASNDKGLVYVRFADQNKVLTSGLPGVDSLLAVHFKRKLPDYGPTTKTVDSFNFAKRVVDDIDRNAVAPPPSDPVLDGKPGPMLTDDQGRPVPNPAEVMYVYEELLGRNMGGFDATNFGITNADPADQDRWKKDQLPWLEDWSYDQQIARSMTVHPHCDDNGCVYPGFLTTGWSNQAAKDDALKLDVDPAKVQDPRNTHVVPVFASVFPPASDERWKGTIPPPDGSKPAWLERVLEDAMVPGTYCGAPSVVHLSHSDGWATSSQWGQVELSTGDQGVVYGDLLGNGSKDGAVDVACTTGGGTSSSVLADEYAVFDYTSGSPKLIGAITPQQPSDTDAHPPFFESVTIRSGRIVANEHWFRSADLTCCPSGRATTTWTYHDGQLTPGKPAVS
jgi:hypothetical protein